MKGRNTVRYVYLHGKRFLRALNHRVVRGFKAVGLNSMTELLILSFVIGVVGGYGAVGFRLLLDFTQHQFWGAAESMDVFSEYAVLKPWYVRMLIPLAGGLLVGPIIYFFVREAKGTGVPEVMEAVITRGGYMRGRVAPLKALVSSISIGSGGSCGREGPIMQIGAGAGSMVGRYLNLSEDNRKTLIGCGASAGIAGTFNAPMAGVMFTLEVLFGRFRLRRFSPLIVSSVMATVVSHSYLGTNPAFDIPEYVFVGAWEIIPYTLLAIICGGLGVLFTRSLLKTKDIFDGLRMPEYLKPALGGLFMGIVALPLPDVYGVGYGTIETALSGKMGWWLMGVLVFGKLVATNLTVGSGGSGGVFAPSLFIGAMTGGCFGQIVHTLFPEVTGVAGSYAVVGMGGMVAGAAQAPITAILILFEMTRDYHLILPLMLTCVVSSIISVRIQNYSIYTQQLVNRGIDIDTGKEASLLRSLKVRDAMNRQVISLEEDADTEKIQQVFSQSHHTHYPVTKKETGEVVGILNYTDYWDYIEEEPTGKLLIARDLAIPPVTIKKDDTLLTALTRISNQDTELLLVVSDWGNRKLEGVLSRNDIINTYNEHRKQQY